MTEFPNDKPSGLEAGSHADAPASLPELSPPSPELAGKILSELRWEERIEGFIEAPMMGPMREYIFKFSDAARLLQADASNPWSTRSGIFGYFEFHELENWIRSVFGDQELADAVAAIAANDISLKERVEKIKSLMELRLRQSEEVLKSNA